ncbi:MAG: 5'-3' exonuclease H3TH domain-containing protein [Candidatus Gracilibacteria bacterium]|nr:5'-3' exonuclease H3TH domain-containing protein [Candidatus Gracilibacteria bacterium]
MKTLFIIDAYNLIYRMFYAIPEMHTRDGRVVNAIFGVAKFLKSLSDEHPHDSIVVATDVGQSFRATEYSEYKAQRDRMPDNLRSQIDGVFALFQAAGIQILSQEGYEADDLIGSIVTERSNGWTDYQFVIISSDKDLCQFVQDGHVHIYDAMKQKFMKEKDVTEKFGVPTSQVRDYLAIVGDSSDNIPGIAGFGPKKATDLLQKYGTLEGIYENMGDLTPKMQEILRDQKENAFLSQKLATIIRDIKITLKLTEADTLVSHVSRSSYIELLQEYQFRSLLPRGQEIVQKVLTKKEANVIKNLADIEKLQNLLGQKEVCTLAIDGDILGISLDGEIYTIDSHVVDIVDFITWLLGSEVEIRGYNLKEEYKKLLSIQKPLQRVSEGQRKLF